MSEPPDLAGRIGLVTGGTQGLGRAVAELMAARGAAGLVLASRDADKGAAAAAEFTADGCPTVFVAADIGTVEGCADIVAGVDREFGACHTFVNCAAVTDRGTVWDTTPELWDRVLAVNTRGPALLAQGVARIMVREQVEGTMVLIGSVAHHGGQHNLLPYAVSKHALVAMTRSLAFQLMRHRIRVNLLNPGWMDTPNEDVVQRRDEGATDGWLERAEAEQPFGRLIKPAEIARTILHLASPESGMLTGASIDWDQTILGTGIPVRPDASLGQPPPLSTEESS